MTLMEAMNRIDVLKPNGYTPTDKTRWLSTLDGIIKVNIIDTHEGEDNVVFNGYTDSTPLTTVLLVPAPYDDIYIHYLEMQIDYTNGEYGKYNNSMAMYESAYSAFANYYNRTRKPKGKKFKFF